MISTSFSRLRIGFVIASLAGALALAPSLARAEVHVDITKGTTAPLPIAITDFIGKVGDEQGLGKNIAQVISADLERSGLFKPVDPKAFIAVEKSLDTMPDFKNWRPIGAQALTQGSITIEGDRISVPFRLWDVLGEQQMAGQIYRTQRTNWRRIAHIIADAIYKRMTGEDGYFDTRIVYIAESGPEQRRIKRLAIMDQDGEGQHFLTDGKDLVLTPRFSPTRQEITYMSYLGNLPRVYIYNIETGRQEVLGDFPGMTFAPRFSPDGNKVIMSMARDGNTEIYTMDLRTRQQVRLTNHPAIDTSPFFSPDGRRIVFNSDRSGTQQLYVMDAAGEASSGAAKRISFGDGRYATPVWSPRGDLIAFTKILGGSFYIGVMNPEGGGERMLAEGFLVESPTWSPNGRVIMFFRETPSSRGGKSTHLYTVDLTGRNEREILTPSDASDPAWSPLIP
jgi:TolB protein